jgi:hypothetical protein
VTTVHLVYPHGPAISCPDAIGRNVGERLKKWFNVKYYDWSDTRVIKPGTDDVLLGHPHAAPMTVFRRSARQDGWRRILVMTPFNASEVGQVAFLNRIVRRSDLYLAITGDYWFDQVRNSALVHWYPKMRQLDIGIDREAFPRLKKKFNPPGHRRFVYIGNASRAKNISYLRSIARLAPQHEVWWIGAEEKEDVIRRVRRLDFSAPASQEFLAHFDFLLTVGSADANPATILEAMAWGLIPACTKESGYTGIPGIFNVPLGDVRGAIAVLDHLQALPEHMLGQLVAENDELLESRFNWDAVTDSIRGAIVSDESPETATASPSTAARLLYAALSGPHSVVRPKNLARFGGSVAKRRVFASDPGRAAGRGLEGAS